MEECAAQVRSQLSPQPCLSSVRYLYLQGVLSLTPECLHNWVGKNSGLRDQRLGDTTLLVISQYSILILDTSACMANPFFPCHGVSQNILTIRNYKPTVFIGHSPAVQ